MCVCIYIYIYIYIYEEQKTVKKQQFFIIPTNFYETSVAKTHLGSDYFT